MNQSKSLVNESHWHGLSNSKRTELIFNAFVMYHAQQSYTEPFLTESLIKCLERIETEVNELYPAGKLRGRND